jgi:hypothetical protein
MPPSVKLDPVSGPLSRQQLAELVTAPFGKAVEVIREYDPQFGRKPGEKYRWRIKARCEMEGTAYVMAADEKEANKLADEITDAAFDWDAPWSSDLEVISVEPDKR